MEASKARDKFCSGSKLCLVQGDAMVKPIATKGLPLDFTDTSRLRYWWKLDWDESGIVMAGNSEKRKRNLIAIG